MSAPRSANNDRISVSCSELYEMLTDQSVEISSSRRFLEDQEERDFGGSRHWKGESSENLHHLPKIKHNRASPDISEFIVGNRSKSFPFMKDKPISSPTTMRKLDARTLEKELLTQFKNRRLNPHSHVQMGMNKSPRQRLQKSFYPSAKQLAVQSLEQFQQNADTATTTTADDRFAVDVIESSSNMHTTVLSEDCILDGTPSKTSTLPSRDYFDGLSNPRWRSLNDAADSGFYSMTRKPRGYAVIINNYEFYKEMIAFTSSGPQTLRVIQKGLRRDGSIEDTDKLSRFFRDELHFIVRGHANVSSYDMIKILNDVSSADHDEFDAFVCCIASHGRRGTLFGSDCREIKVEDVTGLFNGNHCVSLSGKPKCFFIQGCRGNHISQKGVLYGQRNESSQDEHYIPLTCDFLIGYSLIKECTEFHARQSGSLLYKTLVKYFRKYCKRYDLINIMVRVKKALAKLQENSVGAEDIFECNFRAQLVF
ncbi:caspase-7-like [Ostrea edulis]|uniref:caspase-7-like n=1 Tax=Ostrea edulis TaxID=37623 RepID=UPI0024AF018A|nr:caspase-7-like [Ostrea edulis]